jgi:two-component system, NtrC family, sensor histidine kinase KinB
MTLTLRSRIILTLLPLLVLLAVVGGAGALLLYRLGGSIDLILRENYASVIAMERLNEALERIDSSFQFVLARKGEEGAEPHPHEQYEHNWQLYREALTTEQNNVTLPEEPRLVAQLEALTESYRKQGDSFYRAPAEPLYFEKNGLLDTFKEIKKVSGQILHINQQNMEDASTESRRLAANSLVWFAAGLGGAALLSILLAAQTIRTILGPIRAMTRAAQGISAGDLDQIVPYISHDELGDLAQAFNTMARRLRDLRHSHTARLLRAQRTSQASIDSFPDPVLVVDSEGRVEMANPAAQRVLGATVTPGLGGLADSVIHPAGPAAAPGWQFPDALRQPLIKALQEQRPYLPEGFDRALTLRVGGEEHFFLPRIMPVRDPYGNTLGAAVLLQDVTRFRLLDEVKSNLVATVSHELKTPLTSLLLVLHLLLEETVGPLTSKQIELLLDARHNADLLLGRVNNLLDLTRLERGREQLHLGLEQPAELLQAAADTVRTRAEDKGVELVTETASDLPPVEVDVARLSHALGNLLDNAITYTDRGGKITLSAGRKDSQISFSIKDTGIGIPPEHAPHVFDRFFRVPGQSRGGGTGLGLAIAREIISAHGGTIQCDSVPGKGTEFRFTLPIPARALQSDQSLVVSR